MKIEIELEEVERLRKEVEALKKENTGLIKKIDDSTIKAYEQKAILASQLLFQKYMQATFTFLGFDANPLFGSDVFGDISHWLGKRWYEDEGMRILLSATVTNEFRSAFIRFGISETQMKK